MKPIHSMYLGFDGHKRGKATARPGLVIDCKVFPGNGWGNWQRFFRIRWLLAKALWPLVECTVNVIVHEEYEERP